MSQANQQRVHDAPEASFTNGIEIDEVSDVPEGEPFAAEWRAFKRELHRLIADGQTGKFAVLKGDQLVGVWGTLSDADRAGRELFGGAPFLAQEIQRYLKPTRWGYLRPCPT